MKDAKACVLPKLARASVVVVGALVAACGGPHSAGSAPSSDAVASAAALVPADSPVVVYARTVREAVKLARESVSPVLAAAGMSPTRLHDEWHKEFGFDPLSLDDLSSLGVFLDRDGAVEVSPDGASFLVAVRDPSRALELMRLGGPTKDATEQGTSYSFRAAADLTLSWGAVGDHLIFHLGPHPSSAFLARAQRALGQGPSWAGAGQRDTIALLQRAGSHASVYGSVNVNLLVEPVLIPCTTKLLAGTPILRFGLRSDHGVLEAKIATRIDTGVADSLAQRRRRIDAGGMARLFAEAPVALFASLFGESVTLPEGCAGVADTVLPMAPAVESVVAVIYELDPSRGTGKGAVQVYAPSMRFATELISGLGIPDFFIRSSTIEGRKVRSIRFPGIPDIVFAIGASDGLVAVGDGMAAQALAKGGAAELVLGELLHLRLTAAPDSAMARMARDLVRDYLGPEVSELFRLLTVGFEKLEIRGDISAAEEAMAIGTIRATPRPGK